MKLLVILAIVLNLVACKAKLVKRAAAGDQVPKYRDALRDLRGGKDFTSADILAIVKNAVPGKDYPMNAVIPDSKVNCSSFHQPGFYSDPSDPSNCQVFHRCDLFGIRTDYLCGNGSRFNQITLVCDWFYNVDCSVSDKYVDYSNSRLGFANLQLLDNQPEDVAVALGATKPQ